MAPVWAFLPTEPPQALRSRPLCVLGEVPSCARWQRCCPGGVYPLRDAVVIVPCCRISVLCSWRVMTVTAPVGSAGLAVYLKGGVAQREEETKRERCAIHWFAPQMAVMTRPNQSQSSIRVSHMVRGRSPSTWAVSCCSLRDVSRELDRKCSSWDAKVVLT